MKKINGSFCTLTELVQEHGHLLIVYIAALFFDTVSTIRFMVDDGINLEIHPLVRYASYVCGPVLGPFLSAFLFKLLAGIFIIIYLKQYGHYFVKFAALTSFLGGIFNFLGPAAF